MMSLGILSTQTDQKILFSTKDFDVVSKVPGFTNLLKKGILLDNFNAITHPSEPNYVAAGGGSTFGINNDDYYNIPASIKTIYDLLENKGLTWKVHVLFKWYMGNSKYLTHFNLCATVGLPRGYSFCRLYRIQVWNLCP